MATYKSSKTELEWSAEKAFERFSNPENLKNVIANLPADKIDENQRKQLEQIELTPDSITLPGGPVGSISLRISERECPTLVRFTGEGTPVPLKLDFKITPVDDAHCDAQVVLEIDIPMMLKPMVNGPLQKMVDQFGELMRQMSRLD